MPKGRVLIIESDEWASTLLAKFLREAGYDVEAEDQARRGFDKVRTLAPDCIVCGVNLPDIDGSGSRVGFEPNAGWFLRPRFCSCSTNRT